MITSFYTIEYKDMLAEGTDKINANFEMLRLVINDSNLAVPFEGSSVDATAVSLTGNDGGGFTLLDNSTSLFKATIVGTNTAARESALFEVTFAVETRDEMPLLLGQPVVTAYHAGLSSWEFVGVVFTGMEMHLQVKAKNGVIWKALVSETSVAF